MTVTFYDMVKVIYLVSNLRPTGPTNQAYNIITGLNSKSCDIFLVTLFKEGDRSWLCRFKQKNIRVFQINGSWFKPFTTLKILRRFVKANNINVVHSSGFSADLFNVLLHTQTKSVSTYRNHLSDVCEHKGKFMRWISQKIARDYLQKFDVVVGCSKAIQTSLSKELKRDISCVQNGVDTDKYVPCSPQERINLRDSLGVSGFKYLFITVGALSARKDVSTIIKAFKQLQLNDSQLIIIGDGSMRDSLTAEAVGTSNIVFVGTVDNPLSYYQCADAFISASHAEGLPNTVLEALSCSLPCILSDIDSHEEILEYDHNAGMLFKVGSADDLKERITQFLTSDIEGMRSSANKLISDNLSKYRMADNYLGIYNSIKK